MGMEGNRSVATENDPDGAEIESPVAKLNAHVSTMQSLWVGYTMKMGFVVKR